MPTASATKTPPQPVSKATREPLYRRMVSSLRGRIEAGELKPGSPAPSESALIAEFGVSSTTARRCLNELAQAGMVDRVQGKGSFVSALAPMQAVRQVGVLYHDLIQLTDDFCASALQGINRGAEDHACHPVLIPLGQVRRCASPADGLRVLAHRHHLDAVLLLSPLPIGWLEPLLDQGIPVVAVNFSYDDPRVLSVVCDARPGVTRLAEQIERAGHSHVITLRGLFDPRLIEGVKLTSAQPPVDSNLTWQQLTFRYFDDGAPTRVIQAELAKRTSPTVVCCWGLDTAMEVDAALRDLGWCVPDDISLVFMGTPLRPTPYTGETQPIREMSAAAIRLLMTEIDSPGSGPQPEPFTTSPQTGSTLAPPRERRLD